jgi:solute carrier family 5 (sodium-coupled monocarboxylate transporter), member 8/12
MEEYHFHLVDYVVFGAMLVLSATSGIYFGYFKQRKVNAKTRTPDEKTAMKFGSAAMNEYLLGSRSMTPFPVAMSLVASYISAVTMLGTPSEIYNYGSQYWMIIVAVMVHTVIVCTVYLPVFCSLKLGSSYEYLELRFNPAVRTAASVMFVIDEILFLPIIVYVPSLAFNQGKCVTCSSNEMISSPLFWQ